MSKQHFNSNETLEMCDVVVSQDGRVEVKTKSFHTAEMQRLGTPKGPVRGRIQVEGVNILFAPYAEGTRKPTFSQTVVVGSTSLQCTEDNVKVSFKVPRHLSKSLMVMYIQSEIDEVKRRLNEDVYDKLVKGSVAQKGGTE